jgi:hypothetical protein
MSAEFMLDDKDWVVFPKDEPEEIEFEDIEGITNCLDGEEEILTKHNVTMNFTQMHLKATGFLLVTNFRLCFLNFSSVITSRNFPFNCNEAGLFVFF